MEQRWSLILHDELATGLSLGNLTRHRYRRSPIDGLVYLQVRCQSPFQSLLLPYGDSAIEYVFLFLAFLLLEVVNFGV